MSAVLPTRSRRRRAWGLLWWVIPLLGAGYQVAAKMAAAGIPPDRAGAGWLLAMAAEPWTWAMLLCEAASFMVWMAVLADIKLSEAFPLSAISYVLVIASGWTLFHEAITPLQLLGGGAILAGVWLIGAGRRPEPA